MTRTRTATATPSLGYTPSNSPTPSNSVTPRFGPPIIYGGFLLVVLGNATLKVSATTQLSVPVTVNTYADCGPDCTTPSLVRALPLPAGFSGDTGTYGLAADRAFALSGDGTTNGLSAAGGSWVVGFSTYHQGRLVMSNDKSMVTLAGFDNWGNWPLTAKREPSMFRMDYTGYYNITTPCKKINTGSGSGINSPYYCNGWVRARIQGH